MDLHDFDDIHSHYRRGPRIITNINPGEEISTAPGEAWYSVGIHPWDSGTADETTIGLLRRMAADPRVAAIGEAGLDATKGADNATQEAIFIEQAKIAEEVAKPLIIHCVGRFGRIMELRKQLKPAQRWIIHGFRRKPELARQLVAAGFDISLGQRYNAAVPDAIPPQHILHETDCDRPDEESAADLTNNP